LTRAYALIGIHHAGSGHPGGALSCSDVLSALYGAELNLPGGTTDHPGRDRFVLSKGHAAPALYGIWAACGLIDAVQIKGLRKMGTPMQGHPHVLDMPLAESSTGSLGQGFSTALGMALGLRAQGSGARVYTLLGDGELQEGQVWEGAMAAAHFGLSNLLALIDYNKMQSDDLNANIMGLEPLASKWSAFGWFVQEIDGHDPGAILDALVAAANETKRPSVIIAHTVKGKGVSYMEGVASWHGSVKLREEETRTALSELGLEDDSITEWLHG